MHTSYQAPTISFRIACNSQEYLWYHQFHGINIRLIYKHYKSCIFPLLSQPFYFTVNTIHLNTFNGIYSQCGITFQYEKKNHK